MCFDSQYRLRAFTGPSYLKRLGLTNKMRDKMTKIIALLNWPVLQVIG